MVFTLYLATFAFSETLITMYAEIKNIDCMCCQCMV